MALRPSPATVEVTSWDEYQWISQRLDSRITSSGGVLDSEISVYITYDPNKQHSGVTIMTGSVGEEEFLIVIYC